MRAVRGARRRVVVEARAGDDSIAFELLGHGRHGRCGEAPSVSPGRPVVVYGGLGALGFAVARNVRDDGEGSRDIILLGRSGRTSRDPRDSREPSTLARLYRVDASLREDSRLDGIPRLERARVVHASGVLADASLARTSPSRVFRTFAPKTEACRDEWLDSSRAGDVRAYFSSATACVGNAGQCAYGAANATLDRRCARAADAGVSCVSVQWGAFSGGGAASGVERRMLDVGIGLLTPERGVAFARACLAEGCRRRRRVVCASDFDWTRYAARHARRRRRRF